MNYYSAGASFKGLAAYKPVRIRNVSDFKIGNHRCKFADIIYYLQSCGQHKRIAYLNCINMAGSLF